MSDFKLWEIPNAINTLLDNLVDPETGEILTEEEANKLLGEYQEEAGRKTEWLAKEVKNLKAEADALKEQKKVFEQRIKAAENKADRIKNYLDFALGGEKWKAEDASISVSYRNTKNVVDIQDIDSIDISYFKTPRRENNLDKTRIKKEILDGAKIAGVQLVDKKSVIIR